VTPDLVSHVARMDRRVDRLLFSAQTPTAEQVAEIDILCAAIAEVRELLDEPRPRR